METMLRLRYESSLQYVLKSREWGGRHYGICLEQLIQQKLRHMSAWVFKWLGLLQALLTLRYCKNQITCCDKLLNRQNTKGCVGRRDYRARFNRYNLLVQSFDILVYNVARACLFVNKIKCPCSFTRFVLFQRSQGIIIKNNNNKHWIVETLKQMCFSSVLHVVFNDSDLIFIIKKSSL